MKYRQPGYRDQDYKEEREKKREDDRGPRGPREPRGMAREARLVTRCYQCGHQEPALESVPTDALCPKCARRSTAAGTACTSTLAPASSAASRSRSVSPPRRPPTPASSSSRRPSSTPPAAASSARARQHSRERRSAPAAPPSRRCSREVEWSVVPARSPGETRDTGVKDRRPPAGAWNHSFPCLRRRHRLASRGPDRLPVDQCAAGRRRGCLLQADERRAPPVGPGEGGRAQAARQGRALPGPDPRGLSEPGGRSLGATRG